MTLNQLIERLTTIRDEHNAGLDHVTVIVEPMWHYPDPLTIGKRWQIEEPIKDLAYSPRTGVKICGVTFD